MAAELLTPIPSGFLLTANISPLSQSVLQTLHSSISPSQHWWLPISGWGAQGCGMNHLCRSHSILPSTDRSFHSPLTAPYALLLPQLTSPSVRKLPRYRNSPLFQLPLIGARVPPCFLSTSFPFIFHPTQLHGDLSCPFLCLRSSAHVMLVLCENCPICRCSLDAFVE